MRILVLLTVFCLIHAANSAFSQYPWCAGQDYVVAKVIDGSLFLEHRLATYNCCPDSFTFDAAIEGRTLLVTEHEVLTMPCSCLCCYNLSTTITGLAPGVWTVIYRWGDQQEILMVLIEEEEKTEPVLAGTLESSGCLDVGSTPDPAAGRLVLAQNQPNPFNPVTTIGFEASGAVAVNLRVFDSSGRLVRTLLQGEPARPGWNEVVWDGRDAAGRRLASGTYFYRLEAGDFSETKSMVLLR